VLVDCGPASTLETLLEGLGDVVPSALLLTHIHLDHAGAAGALVRRWPWLPVYVHERGARHLADPERLLSSARRLYGDQMDRLWGEMLPVPSQNLHVLTGGETVLGSYAVAYTPGHASHHVSFLGEGTAFAGDVAGVRLTPRALVVPPTPPPDVDVEAWQGSIATLRAWAPERLAITHFGEVTGVSDHLDALASRLEAWSQLARAGDRERYVAQVGDEMRRDDDPEQVTAYGDRARLGEYFDGFARYWAQRDRPG
jgi:glyoxylase-like metal-dependent hydrolase (beta-lactamase superfamily II)